MPESPEQKVQRWGLPLTRVLGHLDFRLHWGPLGDEDTALREWLITRLQSANQDENVAGWLVYFVKRSGIGSARALRGVASESMRTKLVGEIRSYLSDEPLPSPPHTAEPPKEMYHPSYFHVSVASYVSPIALGPCDGDDEIEVLDAVVRFQPQTREPIPEDRFFQLAGVESLGLTENDSAQETLLKLLLDSRLDAEIRQACLETLKQTVTSSVLEKYQWLVEEPRKSVRRKLAQAELGKLKGAVASQEPYERVMQDIDAVFYAEMTRRTGVTPQLAPPVFCSLPPTFVEDKPAPQRLPHRELCRTCITKLVEQGVLTFKEACEEEALEEQLCVQCDTPIELA